MITAENIHYKAGKKTVLHPMSFSIRQGRVTVLLGANGAGKSTLLRLLAGAEKPTAGSVLINQVKLASITPQKLSLQRAVLTQHYAMTLPFTCKDIVMMGRYPHQGTSTAAMDNEIVMQCLQELEATEFTDRFFHTLSGGEQQRVQMARVLAQLYSNNARELQGKILLLDEPTASLDYRHQQLCMDKAKALSKQGCTVLAVLHDLNLAARYADDVLLLKGGRLLAQGALNDTLTAPLVSDAYETPIDILTHDDCPYPIMVPGSRQHSYISSQKTTTLWSLQ